MAGRTTAMLYLDEALALGVQAPDHESYPKITEMERAVCRLVAEQLFLSRSSVEWAVWDSTRKGDHDRWRKIRERLGYGPVKIVKDSKERKHGE